LSESRVDDSSASSEVLCMTYFLLHLSRGCFMRDLVEHRGGWKANFFLFALLALDDRVGENNNGDDLPASEQYRKLERERERERDVAGHGTCTAWRKEPYRFCC